MLQLALGQFAGRRVHHRDLLLARVKITSYNLHRSAPFLRALVASQRQVYSLEGADALIQSPSGGRVFLALSNLCSSPRFPERGLLSPDAVIPTEAALWPTRDLLLPLPRCLTCSPLLPPRMMGACSTLGRLEAAMKRISFCFFFLLASAALAQQPPVPEIPYRSVPDFLKLPPDLYLGEVSGVAVNSKGHVFVFSRGNTTGPAYGAAAAQLLEFDARRQVRARDRPQPLRLVVRARRARSISKTTSGSPTRARTW